jgi:hypothetical protein
MNYIRLKCVHEKTLKTRKLFYCIKFTSNEIVGVIKCKAKSLDPCHVHTSNCETLLLEHVNTGISTKSDNLNRNEFPQYVMHAVEVLHCMKHFNFINLFKNSLTYFFFYIFSYFKSLPMILIINHHIQKMIKYLVIMCMKNQYGLI